MVLTLYQYKDARPKPMSHLRLLVLVAASVWMVRVGAGKSTIGRFGLKHVMHGTLQSGTHTYTAYCTINCGPLHIGFSKLSKFSVIGILGSSFIYTQAKWRILKRRRALQSWLHTLPHDRHRHFRLFRNQSREQDYDRLSNSSLWFCQTMCLNINNH